MFFDISHFWNEFLWVILVLSSAMLRCKYITDISIPIVDFGELRKTTYFHSLSKHPYFEGLVYDGCTNAYSGPRRVEKLVYFLSLSKHLVTLYSMLID